MAAPTFDVANSYGSTASITSDNFTGPSVSAGSNIIAVAKVGQRYSGAFGNVSSITYGGSGMTQAVNRSANPMRLTSFYFINPPTGTRTIAFTVTNGCRLAIGIEIYQGVNLSSPIGDTQGAGGNANTSTLNYSGVLSDSLLLDAFVQTGEPVLTEGLAAQTERYEVTATGGGPAAVKPTCAGSSRDTVVATTTYDSDTTEDFAYAGFELKAAIAAAGIPIDAILNGVPADLILNGVPVNEINT